jgi:hypothetical protein
MEQKKESENNDALFEFIGVIFYIIFAFTLFGLGL